MDFEKICMMFTMQEPFYGIMLSSMERVPVKPEECQTLGVTRSGNVFRLVYNPEFVDPLPVDTVLELLKHEVLHVAFNHFSIWDYETTDPGEWRKRNIAEDMEVNGYLNKSKIDMLNPVYASKINMEDKEGSRAYYKALPDMKQSGQAVCVVVPCNGGVGNGPVQVGSQQGQGQSDKQQGKGRGTSPGEDEFNVIDDHSMWPKGITEAERSLIQQAVDDLVDFAATETEKKCGTIPSEMKGKIEKIRTKPRPVTDWKRYFRRYIGNEFSEVIRKSKKRESKRFPEAAGNRHRRKSHILVGIDTSGSVSMPEYKEFMGQLRTLADSTTFHVIECDSDIQYEYDFKRNIPETLHGGGGTSFNPVIDRYWENKRRYEGIVYFTDGYSSIPQNTPKECLWVISSKGDKNKNKYKVNGASVVFIPEIKSN